MVHLENNKIYWLIIWHYGIQKDQFSVYFRPGLLMYMLVHFISGQSRHIYFIMENHDDETKTLDVIYCTFNRNMFCPSVMS